MANDKENYVPPSASMRQRMKFTGSRWIDEGLMSGVGGHAMMPERSSKNRRPVSSVFTEGIPEEEDGCENLVW